MTEALRPWIREAQNGSTEAVEFILEQFHHGRGPFDGSFGDY